MIRDYIHGFRDQSHDVGCVGFFEQKKVDEPIEIDERATRVDQLRQDLAFGFAGRLPEARSRRYA
jgi:hypothetical protein